HDVCRQALAQILGPSALLKTEIPDSAAVNTALHLRKPLALHSKRSKPAEAYRQLIKELLEVTHERTGADATAA
ncbi:MAG TPA: hypothetical protein VN688_07705, partial [Gemmataceae bacterium]|nr:hypothetical protein [Gemmataceae bacterium]